jgi:hypothetical protein
LKHGFSDLLHVHPDGVNNGLSARGHVGLALMPSGNATASWVYMLLHNGETVIRGKVTNLPMTDEIILHLNTLAKKNKGKYPITMRPIFDRGTEYHTIYSDEIDLPVDNDNIDSQLPARNTIRHDDDGDEEQVVLDTIEINREDGYNDDNFDYQEYADVDIQIHAHDEHVDSHVTARMNHGTKAYIDDDVTDDDFLSLRKRYDDLIHTPAEDSRVPDNQDNTEILNDIFGDDSDDESNDGYVDNAAHNLQTNENVVSDNNDVVSDDNIAIPQYKYTCDALPDSGFFPRRSSRNHQAGRWSVEHKGNWCIIFWTNHT